MIPSWTARVLRGLVVLLVAVFFVPALFVAAVMPYRYWDSLAFGTWSRLIDQTGRLFPSGVIDLNLHRPLFYVAQGLAWEAFGYHEWLGRWLSVLFAAALVLGVWVLAGRLASDGRELVRALAVSGILASSAFAAYVAAGMADVPVAASAALTGAALWSRGLGRAYLPLVALAAAATVLAKPTGLLSLAGLALATVVLLRRDSLIGLVGLAVGSGVGLLYDAVQARRIDEPLYTFLRAGNGDYWLARGKAARWDALLRADWLGEGTRLVVLFGLVYAVARVAGARTRFALAVAGPVAIVWSIAGPAIADGGTPYPFDGTVIGLVAYLLVAASLLTSAFLPVDDPFGRRTYTMLLFWVAPAAIAWFAYRADATRFLSPAWPAMVLVTAAGLASVAFALARIRPALALAPVAGVALLVVGNVTAIDGLGRDGWGGLLELGPSGWSSNAEIENYAYGPFSYELAQARDNVRPGDRIVSNDGRLTYFFPGQVEVAYPTSCAQLQGARFFAELTSGESADFARLNGSSVDPLAWLQCVNPRLQLIGEQAGIYEDFVVGGEPARPPTPGDCRITSYPGDLYDAILAADVDYATARGIQVRASKVGFKQVRIEHTNCSTFRVVIKGFPTTPEGQADFRHEAKSTGFQVSFAPAIRYPEVPPDVEPVK